MLREQCVWGWKLATSVRCVSVHKARQAARRIRLCFRAVCGAACGSLLCRDAFTSVPAEGSETRRRSEMSQAPFCIVRSPGPQGSSSHSERAGRGEVSRPGPPACGSPSAVISPHTFGWSVEEDAACLICRTCTRSASESCRARCRSRLRRFSAFLNSAATRFFSAFKSVCSFFRRSMLARRSLCWLPSEPDAFPGVLAADTGEAADGRLARPGDGVLGAGGSPEAARASPAP